MNPFKSTKEVTDALRERGVRQLIRLERIIDVLFGLLIFHLFYFLPKPEVDNFDKATLTQVLVSS